MLEKKVEILAKIRKKPKKDDNYYIKSPLIYSDELTEIFGTGNDVYLKCDNLQPSGSFKIRGVSLGIKEAVRQGANKIIGSSGGNAGCAMAYMSKKCGLDCEIYIPKSTAKFMKAKIEFYGAKVNVVGKDVGEAITAASQEAAKDDKTFFVHPYAQETAWKGTVTIVDEVKDQLEEMNEERSPAAFVVCVGGGSLTRGVVEGIKKHGWDTSLIAMETKGAEVFNLSIKAGKPLRLMQVTTIATSIAAPECTQSLFDVYMKSGVPISSNVVEDEVAVKGCLQFLDDHRMLVEPACGATLAAIYNKDLVDWSCIEGKDGPIIVEVCGGSVITLEHLLKFKRDFDL